MDWKALFDALWSWLPKIMIIGPSDVGVKTRNGKFLKVCSPGLAYCLPLVDEIIIQPVEPQVASLPNQSLETYDGKGIAITCSLAYQLVDVRKATFDVEDVDSYVKMVISSRITNVVNNLSYDNATAEYIEGRVRSHHVADDLNKVGVRLLRIFVHNLIPHRTIRLLSDNDPFITEE